MRKNNPSIQKMTMDRLGELLGRQFKRIDKELEVIQEQMSDLRKLVDYIDTHKVGYKELDERLLSQRKTK